MRFQKGLVVVLDTHHKDISLVQGFREDSNRCNNEFEVTPLMGDSDWIVIPSFVKLIPIDGLVSNDTGYWSHYLDIHDLHSILWPKSGLDNDLFKL